MPLINTKGACFITACVFLFLFEIALCKSVAPHKLSRRHSWDEPYFEPGPIKPGPAIKDPNAFFSDKCKPFYMNNCMGACLAGYIMGGDGCPTCRCCMELDCRVECPEENQVLNDEGCKTCQCRVTHNTRVDTWIERNRDKSGNYDAISNNRPIPRRPAAPLNKCNNKYCPQSCRLERDFNGCEICQCKPSDGKKKPYQWEKPNMYNSAFFGSKNKVKK